MGALDGYLKTTTALDLEQQRAEKLRSMQLSNDITSYKFDRVKQQQQYQDEKRNDEIRRVKEQYKQLATSKVDDGIVSALKGDLQPLKSILLNSTPDNVNSDLKQSLEADVGGKIIDIKHPNPEDLAEGEQYTPDEVAVDIITPAGERQTHILSLNALGGVIGTADRVGTDEFTKLSAGRYKNVSNAGKAILDSIGFDGEVKHLESSLKFMATVGKDAKSQKLLDIVRNTSAKSGQELLKRLVAEYGNAESPADKAVLVEKIRDVHNMLEATQKKVVKPPKELSQKDQLIKDYRDAVENNQLDKANQLEDIYKKFYGGSNPIDKAEAKRLATERRNKELTQGVKDDLKIEKIYKGETPKVDKLYDYLNRFKTDAQRSTVAVQLANQVVSQDMAKDRALDLSSPKLRKGRIDEKGKHLLDTLKILETANTTLSSSTAVRDAKKTINSAITTITNANNINKEYDIAKSKGLFSGTASTGVLTSVRLNVSKWVGDLFGQNLTDEQLKAKVAQNINGTVSELDAYNNLASKDNLTKDEKKLRDELASKLEIDTTQKWRTETYLVLKKMLQSISGMGVTNQELESFKQAFMGGDQAMLDYMTNQLAYSATSNMKIANAEYKNLTRLGAYYTATDSILRMRAGGSYLIDKYNVDVNTNLDNKPEYRTLAEQQNPAKYRDFTKKVASKLQLQPAIVDDIITTVHNEQLSGKDMNTFYDRHPNLDPNAVNAVIATYTKAFSNLDVPTESGDTTQQPPQTTQPDTSTHDDRLLASIAATESGGSYGAVNGHAYGKYQIMPKVYEQLADTLGTTVDDLKTPDGQERAMRQLLKEHKSTLTSIHVPLTDNNIYTVHQLGAGRAKRYFKGTLTASDYKIMYNNLPKKYKDLLTNKDSELILQAWNTVYREGDDGYDSGK